MTKTLKLGGGMRTIPLDKKTGKSASMDTGKDLASGTWEPEDAALPDIDVDAATARVGTAITQAVNTIVSNVTMNARYINPATEFALARCAREALNTLDVNGNVTEVIDGDFILKPEVLGQIIMQNLPDAETQMSVADKQYWLAVAHHLGPDWIESFRRTAAWMAKAEQF